MGRHFLQTPGPSNCPDEVLRAMSAATIDHRGPEFQRLGYHLLEAVKPVFGTTNPVIIYPSSGTGAWEAALANTLSPGDKILGFETGHFATLWQEMATSLGLKVDFVPGDWRWGIDPEQVAEKLAADTSHEIKAVCCVHNETSTGVATRLPEIRAAIDSTGHPALLLVDAISSLGSTDYRHDEWKVDVTVAGSQKGLMMPPGLGFNAVSDKALEASKTARLGRSYWDWEAIMAANQLGSWPYTPPTNMLFGLEAALRMLDEEGLPEVYARHERHGQATRAAVWAWGLDTVAQDEREYSPSLTAVVLPEGHDADAARKVILERYDIALGAGLSKLAGKVFRIGHLGHINDATLAGVLSGVQMGLIQANVPISGDGVAAALEILGKS
ncbi:MAG TPA: aminotransferase class V-fold PLP-dependent enzyme [Jiangellaceae bacterium]|nr:aminotransferase class V-fold PLP-dependent enzyme [Jiangellaceae bacterium]